MKKHFILFGIVLQFPQISNAQVGINTSTPNSGLQANGSVSLNIREINTNSSEISDQDHYVVFTGNFETNQLFLPRFKENSILLQIGIV